MQGSVNLHETIADDARGPVEPLSLGHIQGEIENCMAALGEARKTVEAQQALLVGDSTSGMPDMSSADEPFLLNGIYARLRQLTILASHIQRVSNVNNHLLFGMPQERSGAQCQSAPGQ